MKNLGYIMDGNKAAKLIASNIYNPVSSIVENSANYYDADATEVRINFKEEQDSDRNVYIKEIVITGDGEGFSISDLDNLMEIGNSKKKQDIYTHKFKRIKLGSFGIAFTAFQNLGTELEIYSKIKTGLILYKRITIEKNLPIFSNVKEMTGCDLIKYETGCTFIIKNCKVPKSVFYNRELLENKLAYLPISENFKIYLNEKEVKRFIVTGENLYIPTFGFNIGDVQFKGEVCYSPKVIRKRNFRGVYLKIDERIIDWNIYNDIRYGIRTPGSVESKIQGYIVADGLRDKINAGRNGLTDTSLALIIGEMLKKNIRNIHAEAKEHYGWKPRSKQKSNEKNSSDNSNGKEIISTKQVAKEETSLEVTGFDTKLVTIEKKEEYKKYTRKEKAQKRIKNTNNDLKRLGIEFCYEPECEIELIIIVAQMCQKRLLDFQIKQAISNDSPDSIIIKDGRLAFLEFELLLNNFYSHEHSHNNIDYILCWDIDKKIIVKNQEKYLEKYSSYLKSIQLREVVDDIYCSELIFNNYDGTQHIIKLYTVSEIIKKL